MAWFAWRAGGRAAAPKRICGALGAGATGWLPPRRARVASARDHRSFPRRSVTPQRREIWIQWTIAACMLLLFVGAFGFGIWLGNRPWPPQIIEAHVVYDPPPGKTPVNL